MVKKKKKAKGIRCMVKSPYLFFFYFFSEQDILDLETGVLQNPGIK